MGKKFSRCIWQDAIGTCRRTIGRAGQAARFFRTAEGRDNRVFTPDVENCCQISAAPHSLRLMRTILLIILILLLIGAFPAWPYSTGWGYYPSGGIGLILLIVLILALTGRL